MSLLPIHRGGSHTAAARLPYAVSPSWSSDAMPSSPALPPAAAAAAAGAQLTAWRVADAGSSVVPASAFPSSPFSLHSRSVSSPVIPLAAAQAYAQHSSAPESFLPSTAHAVVGTPAWAVTRTPTRTAAPGTPTNGGTPVGIPAMVGGTPGATADAAAERRMQLLARTLSGMKLVDPAPASTHTPVATVPASSVPTAMASSFASPAGVGYASVGSPLAARALRSPHLGSTAMQPSSPAHAHTASSSSSGFATPGTSSAAALWATVPGVSSMPAWASPPLPPAATATATATATGAGSSSGVAVQQLAASSGTVPSMMATGLLLPHTPLLVAANLTSTALALPSTPLSALRASAVTQPSSSTRGGSIPSASSYVLAQPSMLAGSSPAGTQDARTTAAGAIASRTAANSSSRTPTLSARPTVQLSPSDPNVLAAQQAGLSEKMLRDLARLTGGALPQESAPLPTSPQAVSLRPHAMPSPEPAGVLHAADSPLPLPVSASTPAAASLGGDTLSTLLVAPPSPSDTAARAQDAVRSAQTQDQLALLRKTLQVTSSVPAFLAAHEPWMALSTPQRAAPTLRSAPSSPALITTGTPANSSSAAGSSPDTRSAGPAPQLMCGALGTYTPPRTLLPTRSAYALPTMALDKFAQAALATRVEAAKSTFTSVSARAGSKLAGDEASVRVVAGASADEPPPLLDLSHLHAPAPAPAPAAAPVPPPLLSDAGAVRGAMADAGVPGVAFSEMSTDPLYAALALGNKLTAAAQPGSGPALPVTQSRRSSVVDGRTLQERAMSTMAAKLQEIQHMFTMNDDDDDL